jgi:hypothetical protein
MTVTAITPIGNGVDGTQLPTLSLPSVGGAGVIVVVIGTQVNTGQQAADYTNDGSFTRFGVPFALPSASIRYHGLWTKSGATSAVTFTRAGTTVRQVAIALGYTGVDLTTPISTASTTYGTLAGSTVTAAALTAADDASLAVATFSASWAAGQDHAPSSVTGGWTLAATYVIPTSGSTALARSTVHVYSSPVAVAGTTGPCALTYTGTPAQATGQMFVVAPGVDPPTVPTLWLWDGSFWQGPCTIEEET